MRVRVALLVLCSLALWLLPAASAMAAPPNDNFADAEVLIDDTPVDVNTFAATREASEPTPVGNSDKTVWYRWTAPSGGYVTVTGCTTEFDAFLAVYTGTDYSTPLTTIGSSDGGCGSGGSVSFWVASGTTYHVQHGSYFAGQPTDVNLADATILLAFEPGPANDDVANAVGLVDGVRSASVDLRYATREAGEPAPVGAAEHSAWYTWTATDSGLAYFDNCDIAPHDAMIAVYRGSGFGDFQVAASADSSDCAASGGARVGVWVEPGETFFVQHAMYYLLAPTAARTGSVLVEFHASPDNDDFTDALHLGSSSTTSPTIANQYATLEAGEPNTGGRNRSVWFTWTAPADGLATFDSCNSGYDTELYVYTGIALGALTQVGSGGDSCTANAASATVNVTSGTTYVLQHMDYSTYTGTSNLNVSFEGIPANDDYANATDLGSDVNVSISDDNRLATREAGEGTYGIGGNNDSVWYRWTAPASGLVQFDNCTGSDGTTSSFDSGAAVLLESGGLAASAIAAGDQGCPGGSYTKLTFTASQGVVYRFVISAWSGGEGSFDVHLTMAPFMTAQPQVTGTMFVGNTVSATSGTWGGAPTITYAYQWKRCVPLAGCSDIAGATSSSYELAGADDGNRVQVEVTATNGAGSVAGLSSQSLVIDLDTDADGVGDDSDNCVTDDNAGQANNDGDAEGDVCDLNDDNDSAPDTSDAFPFDASEQLDTDGDTTGNNADTDDDGDGALDGADAFPLDASEQLDTDSDGTGNNADTNDDGDAALDVNDAFPLDAAETTDTDGDGTGNNADTNDDGDSALDVNDAFPVNAAETTDTDGDGTGNNADADDDGDGALDGADAFPLNAAEKTDTDGDGTGNNGDADDDGDGTADTGDAFPLDKNESTDTDGDGTGNNADPDDDADGVSDADEAARGTNPLVKDSDGDGVADGADKCGTVAAATADGCKVVLKVTFVGNAAVNKLVGNALANVFRLGGGNDRCAGRGGNDTCYGDAGNDYCDGGVGNDTCNGGIGADICVAISGTDKCLGGGGNDTSNTRDGRGGDTNNGGPGRDICRGDRRDIFISCEVKRFT